jgi:hypothetical protein
MGTKQYDSATDLLTFSRASGGTALSKISYGNELVTNGTFDSDLSGWTTNSASWDNGTLQVDYQQYNTYSKQLLTGLVVGKSYQVGYTVTSDTQGSGGSAFVAIFTSNSDYSSIAGSSYVRRVAGSYTFAFTATTPTVQLRLKKGGYTGVTTFDNVSVKEVLFDQADGTLQLWNHGNNVPRIEYDATGAVKGLLIEEARTNLLTYSNVFANSAWSKQNLTATANQATGPDGTVSATEIGITGTAGNSYSINSTASTTGTISYFAKQNTERFFLIVRGVYGAGDWAIFDLSNGTVSKSPTHNNSTAHITPMGNGWYRCVLQSDNYTTINAFSISGSGTDYNTPTSGTVYLYGAQMEAGAFPTSYIPTTGATATRARDLAEIPTSAFGYNNDQGSVAVEFKSNKPSSDFYGAFVLSDGSPTNRIVHYTFNGGQHRGAVVSSGVLEVDVVAGSRGAPSELVKFAVGFSDNNFAASLNGATAVTDTSVTIPSGLSKLALGYYYPTNPQSNMLNGHIKSIQYYPRRLTDTQLQELTT